MNREPQAQRIALHGNLVEQDHAPRSRAEHDKADRVLRMALAFGVWGPALVWACSKLL